MIDKLIYLVATYKLPYIPKPLVGYTPHYALLKSISDNGLIATSAFKDVPFDRVQELFDTGKVEGGSQRDTIALLSKHYIASIADASLETDERLALYSALTKFIEQKESLLDTEQTSFVINETDRVAKIPTGFAPLDNLIEGITENTFMTVMAQSGNGKSSMMLVLADALATKYGKRVVWFSYEMRAASVKDRARYLDLHRNPNNLIITGNITLDMIEEYCNEDTIVVVDYLDLGISTVNEGLRFALIAAYQRALQLSKKSFCFITASQVNKGILSVSSGNESAAKAHYPELILGIAKQGSSLLNKGYSTVELSVLKNRYGVSDAQTTFELDYKTLQYKEYSRGGTVVYDEEALLQLGGV